MRVSSGPAAGPGHGTGIVLQPGQERVAASGATRSGAACLWIEDRAYAGGDCGLALSLLVGAIVGDRPIGVWVEAGRDHPLRFAEDTAFADRQLGGRLRVGTRLERSTQVDWVVAVAAAWSGEPLLLERPLRIPAGDPENAFVPPGWSPRVRPVPLQQPLRWWLDAAGRLPSRVAAVPCRRVRVGGLPMVVAAEGGAA